MFEKTSTEKVEEAKSASDALSTTNDHLKDVESSADSILKEI
jgi:hypothetical protein